MPKRAAGKFLSNTQAPKRPGVGTGITPSCPSGRRRAEYSAAGTASATNAQIRYYESSFSGTHFDRAYCTYSVIPSLGVCGGIPQGQGAVIMAAKGKIKILSDRWQNSGGNAVKLL